MDSDVSPTIKSKYAETCPKARALWEDILGSTSNATKRRQLINLWTALERQATANSDDYRAVTIGARTTELGGPTTQTLRNANGQDYRTIIAAFCEEIGATGKPTPKASSDPFDDLVKGIGDRTLRHQVRMIVQENKSLKNEVNLLKRTLANSAHPIPSLNISAAPITEVAEPPVAGQLKPSMRAALVDFVMRVDEKRKFRENEFGAVVDVFDDEIAAPGFVQGLRILLAMNKAT